MSGIKARADAVAEDYRDSIKLRALIGVAANRGELCRLVADQAARIEELESECEAAARFVEESPCDPDITAKQVAAWLAYQDFLEARLTAMVDREQAK